MRIRTCRLGKVVSSDEMSSEEADIIVKDPVEKASQEAIGADDEENDYNEKEDNAQEYENKEEYIDFENTVMPNEVNRDVGSEKRCGGQK